MADDVPDPRTDPNERPDPALVAGITGGQQPPVPPKVPGTTQPNPDEPDPSATQTGLAGSKFAAKSAADMLRESFGMKTIDPHLAEMLKDAKARQMSDKKGLMIDTEGRTIFAGAAKGGALFIGAADRKPVDEKAAEVMIAMAKSKGWNRINVNGSPQEQDIMWIEAQRQGLKVSNYTPDPNSEVAQAWKDEQVHGRNWKVSQGNAPAGDDANYHLKTMQLLQEKMKGSTDPDVKKALGQVLDKFKNGDALAENPRTFAALQSALADPDAKKGFNTAADVLNKADPKLGLAHIDAGAGAPAATAPKVAPRRQQPAAAAS